MKRCLRGCVNSDGIRLTVECVAPGGDGNELDREAQRDTGSVYVDPVNTVHPGKVKRGRQTLNKLQSI